MLLGGLPVQFHLVPWPWRLFCMLLPGRPNCEGVPHSSSREKCRKGSGLTTSSYLLYLQVCSTHTEAILPPQSPQPVTKQRGILELGHFCVTQGSSVGKLLLWDSLPGQDFLRATLQPGAFPPQSSLLAYMSDLLCGLKTLPTYSCSLSLYPSEMFSQFWLGVCYPEDPNDTVGKKWSKEAGSKIRCTHA